MKIYIVCGFILFTFYGCSYKVGGDCNYQSTKGIALIKSKTQNICIAEFTPKKVKYDIQFTCKNSIKVGNSYRAILKKATHSSCTPIILNIIKDIK